MNSGVPKRKTAGRKAASAFSLAPAQLADFRTRLSHWYSDHARTLPWRGTSDPYRIWVSEIMLQQTRVAAVLDHYDRFLRLFPTVTKLASAAEDSVLAAWSGLGYYRRARMLHRAAQIVAQDLGGVFPSTSAGLRKLPGIGEYTAAAIASICFGEGVAVVDANVERVLLRVTGRPEETSAAARTHIARQAAALVPAGALAADHNQAMMELGATVCLPRGPLCLECPVYDLCRTRGEHLTPPREKQRSRPAAYLLATRKHGNVVQVLLEQRDPKASLMPGMYELPPLPLDAVAGREPMLRLRHSITDTNYYVQVYAEESTDDRLRDAIPAAPKSLGWKRVSRLAGIPLTGLARKVLNRLDLQAVGGLNTPAQSKNLSAAIIPVIPEIS
jgi:A/G-specific adenine glycosylase